MSRRLIFLIMILAIAISITKTSFAAPYRTNPSHLTSVVGDIYRSPRKPKAFVLDTVLWPANPTTGLYNIPVCWENLTHSTVAERKLVTDALTASWSKESLARFNVAVGGQCIATSKGIRITVNNDANPQAALGKEGDGKIGVMILNFRLDDRIGELNFPFLTTIFERCQTNGFVLLDTCIKSSVIHEFGHVLGIAHE